MRRFFIDKNCIKEKSVEIQGKEAHHIKDVIRLRPGDRFLGFDGTGKNYTLRVITTGDTVKADIEKISSGKVDMPKILLAVSMPKKSKIDEIIEKATELGVSEIIPMATERTIVKVDKKTGISKQKRWERIALEASKQCGRDELPKIYEPMNFKDVLELTTKLGYKTRVIPYVGEGTKNIRDALKRAEESAVFIGPEGDFTDKEIELAEKQGLEPVSLGPLVLRVDTACIFSLSVIQSALLEG